jgi:hypothetical protein
VRAEIAGLTGTDGPYKGWGRWVEMLGFRGHFASKSRRYSTTLGRLRHARRDHTRRSEGITTGACQFSLRTIPGGGSIPLALTVNDEPLTSAATIQAGIDAGLLVAIDTGAVFRRHRQPREVRTSRRV